MGQCFFSWTELAAATRGEWCGALPRAMPGVQAISTDSRNPAPQGLFLALVRERDGHGYIIEAVKKGSVAACVDHRLPPAVAAWLAEQHIPCLRVADTLAAFQALARWHRDRQSNLRLVAVTGSSGKTSTKEMIAAILRQAWPSAVLATEGNTNNLFGLPQNLLRLEVGHRVAVLELGTNSPGEIGTLEAVAQPNVAVITSVGPVHLQGLGSLEGVAREKAAIFAGLAARQGRAVIPQRLAANPIVRAAAGERVLTFGEEPGANVRIEYLGRTPDGSSFRIHRRSGSRVTIRWHLLGRHLARNAGAAAAVADWLDVSDQCLQAGLESVILPGMRMKELRHRDVRWLNDAYNANPDSMEALIETLVEEPLVPGAHLHLVLGDMLELGSYAAEYHRQVLQFARQHLPAARLWPFGPEMAKAAAELHQYAWTDIGRLQQELEGELRPQDLVALKASRGMALERLLPSA